MLVYFIIGRLHMMLLLKPVEPLTQFCCFSEEDRKWHTFISKVCIPGMTCIFLLYIIYIYSSLRFSLCFSCTVVHVVALVWTHSSGKCARQQYYYYACKAPILLHNFLFYTKNLNPDHLTESIVLQGKFNPTQCEALTMVCAQVSLVSSNLVN